MVAVASKLEEKNRDNDNNEDLPFLPSSLLMDELSPVDDYYKSQLKLLTSEYSQLNTILSKYRHLHGMPGELQQDIVKVLFITKEINYNPFL
jgi:hypothetical protein